MRYFGRMSLDRLASYDLRVNHAGFFESYKDGVWNPPTYFDDNDLLVITFGTASCIVNGNRHTITPHDVIVFRRGDRLEQPLAAGRLCNMLVHFDFLGPDGKVVDPPGNLLPPRFPAAAQSHVVANMTQHVMDAYQQRQPAAASAFLKSILLALVGQPETRGPDLSAVHRTRLIREVAERILRNPAPKRSVPELAAEVGMSAVHFTRHFRRCVGSSPGEFMILARIEQAKLLLTTTSREITEVADLLGYSDEYYFSRQFALKTGYPPAAYRRRHLEAATQ